MMKKITTLNQTQINFINKDVQCYKDLVYSFYFNNCVKIDYNMNTILFKKVSHMHNEPISTTDRWHLYEQVHGEQSYNDILELIKNNQKKISELRGRPIVAYITAINSGVSPSQINLNDEDVKNFVSLISDVDNNEREIDIILHSYGGYIESAHKIIELLRDRFEKVNFLIPFAAHSATSMMCMSADEIIMTPESSLSPFDTHVLSPDDNTTYLPAVTMIKCVKDAKRAHNPLCIFMPKGLYENWNGKMIRKTKQLSSTSIKQSKSYPLYWLMKYMFKSCNNNNMFFINFLFMPFWKKFTANGRKANHIVKLFINTGTHLSHNTPIMYHDLKNIGLKVSKADGELLSLLRETYQLSDVLFERSTIKKLFTNIDKSFFNYVVNKDQ